ncbi:MAG TPA: hypothetical protein DDW52_16540 [Planctomycetaceae bacterium]|nr:hypothetical protein [Planctomycetaceae bacterium]
MRVSVQLSTLKNRTRFKAPTPAILWKYTQTNTIGRLPSAARFPAPRKGTFVLLRVEAVSYINQFAAASTEIIPNDGTKPCGGPIQKGGAKTCTLRGADLTRSHTLRYVGKLL